MIFQLFNARPAAKSYNHPEGIKDTQAIALTVFLARTTREKELIKRYNLTSLLKDLSKTSGDLFSIRLN